MSQLSLSSTRFRCVWIVMQFSATKLYVAAEHYCKAYHCLTPGRHTTTPILLQQLLSTITLLPCSFKLLRTQSLKQSARAIRRAVETRGQHASTDFKTWSSRGWLDVAETTHERLLATCPGSNPFVALTILANVSVCMHVTSQPRKAHHRSLCSATSSRSCSYHWKPRSRASHGYAPRRCMTCTQH